MARRMLSRDPHEPHRVATPLELLFDLCFVVAVAQASAKLHHGLAEGHGLAVVLGFVMVFFAIWWAWMNFTWFASAYDTDTVSYRLRVLVQIVGVLVLAAGIPRVFDSNDLSVVTIGYVMMRVGLIAQWLQAAHDDVPRRRSAIKYAVGLAIVQVGWVARIWLPAEWTVASWAALVVAELLVPLVAERGATTLWHPHHIEERYGSFTLIVLGEAVLSSTVAMQTTLDLGHLTPQLAMVIVGSILATFSMWWIYFDRSVAKLLDSPRAAFLWGYGHFFVFASIAALGAGIELSIEHRHEALSAFATHLALTAPIAVFLVTVWALHVRPTQCGPLTSAAFLVGAAAILASTVLDSAALASGLVLVTVLVVKLAAGTREGMKHS